MKKLFTIFNAILLVISFIFITNSDLLAFRNRKIPVTPPVTPPTTITPTEKPPKPTQTPKPPKDEDDEDEDKDDEQKTTGGVKGTAGEVEFKLAFNAKNNPLKGHVVYSNSLGSKLWGTVDVCYKQENNQAVFSGTVIKSKGETTTGDYFLVEVVDNGEGKDADNDRAWLTVYSEKPACEFSGNLSGIVEKGNVQVH